MSKEKSRRTVEEVQTLEIAYWTALPSENKCLVVFSDVTRVDGSRLSENHQRPIEIFLEEIEGIFPGVFSQISQAFEQIRDAREEVERKREAEEREEKVRVDAERKAQAEAEEQKHNQPVTAEPETQTDKQKETIKPK